MQIIQKAVDPTNRYLIASRTEPNTLQQLQDKGLRPRIWWGGVQAGQRAVISTCDQRVAFADLRKHGNTGKNFASFANARNEEHWHFSGKTFPRLDT